MILIYQKVIHYPSSKVEAISSSKYTSLLLYLGAFIQKLFIDGNADIPEDEDTMLRQNALKLTRQNAINQCKKMTNLVDNIAETAIKSMVAGEELRTKSPLGVQMLMTK